MEPQESHREGNEGQGPRSFQHPPPAPTTPPQSPHIPASQPLVMRVRRAWHTVTLRSGRSLMAIPRVRASPRKEAATSVGLVQKPGRRVQIWGEVGDAHSQEQALSSQGPGPPLPATVVCHRSWTPLCCLPGPDPLLDRIQGHSETQGTLLVNSSPLHTKNPETGQECGQHPLAQAKAQQHILPDQRAQVNKVRWAEVLAQAGQRQSGFLSSRATYTPELTHRKVPELC